MDEQWLSVGECKFYIGNVTKTGDERIFIGLFY
jgi:hypothetical protein